MAVVKRKVPSGSKPKKREQLTEKEEAPLALPDKPSVPLNDLSQYSILLHGEKKIGKTTLTSKFPNTMHLMTEPGGKALAIHQVPITSWQDFRGYLKLLKKDRRFKNVVVDTIDLLFKMAEKRALTRLGIEHASEETWGRGWAAIRDEFTGPIQELLSLDKGVILVSHSVEREVKRRSGSSYHRIQPTLAGQGRDIIEGMVDAFFYYHYDDDGHRVLQIRGDDHVLAGHRLQDNHFRWKGKEVEVVSMGTSPDEAYTNLMNAFHNRYDPGVPSTTDIEPKKPFKLVKRR